MSAQRLPWYRRLTVKILISASLLLLCLGFVEPAELAVALEGIGFWYFTVALALNLIGTVFVKAWIAYLTTRASGLRLRFVTLVRINLIARFYTIALPRGASAAVRWHHYRQGGSGHAAAALLVFENLVSVFMLFFGAAFVLSFEAGRAGALAQGLLPVAWLGAIGAMAALLPFLHRASARIFCRLLQPLVRRPGRLGSLVGRFLEAIDSYHSITGRQVGWIFIASALGYVFFVLAAWVLAISMSLGVGLLAIAWVRAVTLLVALVPVTVAGIGLRDAALIVLLREYGVSPGEAFAYAIASFAIQLLLGLAGALIEALRVFRGQRAPTTFVDESREELP
jgi:uncharacterized protein (TIRG00374 family)